VVLEVDEDEDTLDVDATDADVAVAVAVVVVVVVVDDDCTEFDPLKYDPAKPPPYRFDKEADVDLYVEFEVDDIDVFPLLDKLLLPGWFGDVTKILDPV
jgi:hypothetical protein